MKSTRVGVYMMKGTLLFIAVLSTIFFATILTQNAFAQENEGSSTDPQYDYSQDVIENQEPLSMFSPKGLDFPPRQCLNYLNNHTI